MHTIQRIVTGNWRENCYIVSGADQQALIIDPGEEFSAIRDAISAEKLTPKAVINTHAHFDHIGAVAAVVEEYRIPFYLHAGDFRLLSHANLYTRLFDGLRPVKIPKVDFDLSKHDALSFDGLELKVFATPGHTMGGVSLLIGQDLFTGDTLLPGEIGRTDLPGGSAADLIKSVRLLLSLPGETIVHGGHGDSFLIRDALENKAIMARLEWARLE